MAGSVGDTMRNHHTALSRTIPGSLQAQSNASGAGLAETFLSCDLIAIIDVSGSMSAQDAPGEYSRYDAACRELAALQARHPGNIGVIAFSSTTIFCPGGVPPFLEAGTNLAEALEYAHVADGCDIQFVVISDGEPQSEADALRVAGRFQSRIDTVYVGPEGGRGVAFLRQLAAASGGQHVTAAKTAQLAQQVERLRLTSGA